MNKSSKIYWRDRKSQYDESLYKDETRMYAKLAAYYEKEAVRLDKEIAAYYAKYGVNGVLSYRNLLETLPDTDKTLLIEKIDDFVKKYPEYADLVPVRESIYKLNRLEGLRQSIALQQMEMGAYEKEQARAFFQKQALRYANGAAEYLGLGKGFYRLDHEMVQMAIGNKWCDGMDFSNRIWNNRTKLGNTLQTEIVNGFIRGEDYHTMSRNLRKKFVDVSQKNAERLVFTEDTYLSNESAMLVFEKEAAITEYTFVSTGDSETCDICRALSGQRFKIKDRLPGTNFPPMHPWCRCFFDPVVPKVGAFRSGEKNSEKALTSVVDDVIMKSNYAREIDIFSYDTEEAANSNITPSDIIDDLKTSKIGLETLFYLEDLPELPKLDYTYKPPNGLKGEEQGGSIVVYIKNCKDVKTASCTLIHECTHRKYGIGQSQWAECVCVSQEILHRRNRNYLTIDEKRMIIRAVKSVYPEYNWKRGGYIYGRKRTSKKNK